MKNYLESDFVEKFKRAYEHLYNQHPPIEEEDFRYRYLRVDWFFPNHVNNVLKKIVVIGEKYFTDVDYQVCLYAGLFHDAGLVYKRESASTLGHENRSVEYAKNELNEMGYDVEFIEKVSECIKATEPEYRSDLSEAQLVRNADAYAHIISRHFFGKANFTKDIDKFISWFDEKLETTYIKISIPKIKEEIGPLVKNYKEMIANYRSNQNKEDFLNNFFV